MRRTRSPRPGFTLVELMVAAALSLVVMTVLSLAFQTGMQTLSQLKSVVGMAENLRAAEGVLRRDLIAYHLEADQSRPVRLSENNGHTKGYFAFTQGGMAQTAGGPIGAGPLAESASLATADAPQSFRTQPANLATQLFGRAWMDTLGFTVRLTGEKPQEVFTAPAVGEPTSPTALIARLRNTDPAALPPETRSADPTTTQLTSRWAEVVYLLQPSGPNGANAATVLTSDEGGVTSLPLYTLYRRQRVLADRTIQSQPTGANVFGATDAVVARGVAMAQPGINPATDPWVVLGPERLVRGTDVGNRLGQAFDRLAPAVSGGLPTAFQQDLQRRGYPIPSGAGEFGSDVLLNNVVSMTVRPVYEFDVGPAIASQLQSIISGGGSVTPLPKSLAAPGYAPTDWLELLGVPTSPLGPNNKTQLPAPATAQFPRFYDTAGPSQVGVVFRNNAGNALPIQWDQTPGASEISAKLKAIEIKLRVYDSKNKTSRQVTILQDL